MNYRTYEGPMDWEYQSRPPVDPTSPFAQAASYGGLQNGFASPSKGNASSRPNPFATPSKSQPPKPLFTPQQSSAKPNAPRFRNPAFTTPRKPFDEVVLSEASGAEESPAQGEHSDFPNDTPETDRDVSMVGTGAITPTKVDKAYRYQKNGVSSRKHMSGKGEIRPRHDLDMSEVTRRKRRQHDRDFSSHRRLNSQDTDDDSDASYHGRYRSRHKADRNRPVRGGMIGSMFHMMEEHHNAPENLRRWIQLGINVFLGGTFCAIVISIMQTIRSDIRAVNEGARQEIRAKMAACHDQYTSNGCDTTNAPAFKVLCGEWHDCMMQDPESIVRVRATMAEAANIMNDFFGNLNLKAWGAFLGILLIVVFANNISGPKTSTRASAPAAAPQPSHQAHGAPAPQSQGDVMWIPVQTPRTRRQAYLADDTDTDGSPPKSQRYLSFDKGMRGSPSKRERSLSPVKYNRSPRKDFFS